MFLDVCRNTSVLCFLQLWKLHAFNKWSYSERREGWEKKPWEITAAPRKILQTLTVILLTLIRYQTETSWHHIGERFLAPYSAIINAAILCGRYDIVCSRHWKPGLRLSSCYASWFHAALLLSWAIQHQNPIISTPNPHSGSNCRSLQKANGISCSHLP